MQVGSRNKTKIYRGIQLIISAGITALLLVLLFSDENRDSLLEIFAAVDLSGVLFYIFLSICGILIRAWRYQIVVRDLGESGQAPSYGQLVVVTTVRNALTDFLPARLGEVCYIYMLSRLGVPLATGASTFGTCIFFDVLVLALAMAAFFLLMPFLMPNLGASFGLSFNVEMIFAAVFSAMTLILLLVGKNIGQLRKFLSLAKDKLTDSSLQRYHSLFNVFNRLIVFAEKIFFDVMRFQGRGHYLLIIVLTFLLRTFKYSSLYVLLIAVISQWGITASQLHPGLVVSAFVSAEAAASLPISGIMGFGAYEGVWSLVFSAAKLQIPSTLQLSFAVHVITQIKAYSLAVVAACWFFWWDLRQQNRN